MPITIRNFFLLFFLLLPFGKLLAHPHIWATTTLKPLIENNQIQGININWVFDELYSASFLMEADANQNKKLDPEETQDTINAVFIEGEEDLHPFFYMHQNQKDIPFSLQNPHIYMNDKEELVYNFDVIFDAPLPLQGSYKFATFDPEFYVAFEQALTLTLPQQSACTQTLKEDKSVSIYNGLINPETYTLTCS